MVQMAAMGHQNWLQRNRIGGKELKMVVMAKNFYKTMVANS
jgi:hypothetical protein